MRQYHSANVSKNHQNANLFDNMQNQGHYLHNIGCNQWNVSIFTVRKYSGTFPINLGTPKIIKTQEN